MKALRSDPLLIAALCLLLLYLAWAAVLPHGVFDTVDEGGKVLYLQNTLRTADPSAPFIYPGGDLDPAGQFFPTWWRLQRGGQFYTWWQPGFPLLTLPFYALLGWMGLYILPALSGAVIAYLTGRLIQLVTGGPGWLAVLGAVSVGLATPVMYYSTNFHEHTLSTALTLGSLFLALLAHQQKRPRLAVWAGVLASLAVFFRTETVTILFGVGLVLLLADWRMGLRFGVAFALACLPWMALNAWITGYPINHHVSEAAAQAGSRGVDQLGLSLIPKALFGQGGVGALAPTRAYLLTASALSLLGALLAAFRRSRALAGLCFLAAGLSGVWLLVSPTGYRTIHGLVTVAPQILFAALLLAARPLWKRSLLPFMLLAGGAAFAVVYILQAWSAAGGIQWGPRYMLSFYPLLITAGLAALYELWPQIRAWEARLAWGSFLVCALIGLGFAARGWWTNYRTLALYRASQPAFQSMADAPLVSYYCDPPLHIPELYWQQTFFSASRSGWPAWEESSAEMGLAKYYLLESWDLCSAEPFTQMETDRQANPSGLTVSEIQP